MGKIGGFDTGVSYAPYTIGEWGNGRISPDSYLISSESPHANLGGLHHHYSVDDLLLPHHELGLIKAHAFGT